MSDDLFYEIELQLSKDSAQDVVIHLDQYNSLPDLSGYYEVLYDEEDRDKDTAELVFYFPLNAIQPELNLHILLSALGIDNYKLTTKSVNKQEYLEAYKDHYKPFRISDRFVIVPSWDKDTARETEHLPENGISLYLDPGLAFGTGQHATTKLCLEFLDRNLTKNISVIDAGTGSGILAIGALLLGARHVFAFDVDGNSVQAVRQNAALNSVGKESLTIEQGGFDCIPDSQKDADILIANITFQIIKNEKAGIDSVRSPVMVLSGVLENRLEELKELFQEKWNFQNAESLDGWICAVFKRKK
jgi:ribosomal protein L11 methyltransferase